MLAAEATQTLRIGTTVFANDFRHPAVLAKEAATLDLLSGGRLELGLGAGYLAPDYALTGIALDPPGVRVSRLMESVQIIKGLFGDEPVTFAGRYYTITDLEGYPKPVQRPHPPLYLAGGSKRVLSLAAREADIVGLVPPSGGGKLDFLEASMAATMQRVEWVRHAAGERLAALELNTLLFAVVVTEHRQQAAEQLAATRGTTAEQVLDSIHFLVGTVEQMVEQIHMWRERLGISYITVLQEYMDALAPVVARLAGT
jgi:probable F420-dependent oxidoreductase